MASENPMAALFSLAGRTALVTGGTSGLGEMFARGLLMAGARVFITGRDKAKADAAAAALASEAGEGADCRAFAADLADDASLQGLVAEVAAQAPDLSILVNNAGMTAHAPFGEYPAAHFDALLDLNVKAPFMLAQGLHPVLRANASSARPAHILNVGSIAGLITTTPGSFAYGPGKAAVHHMTRVLARKLAPDRICVNAVAPGLFPSRMSAWVVDDPATLKATLGHIPLGRTGEPDDLARLIIYIASSSYMTGAIITLDGGLAL